MEEAEIRFYKTVSDYQTPAEVNALVTPRQTHTASVAEVTGALASFPETDALVTRIPGIELGVRTADCVPVLMHAPDINAIAAIHAGWKGTLGRIVAKTVERLKEMGADPEQIKMTVGPHICGECYEVSEELADKFRAEGLVECVSYLGTGQDNGVQKPHIKLGLANILIAKQCGIKEENIHDCGICTLHTIGADGHQWPSWRRVPGTTIRLLSTVHIRKK